MSRTLAFIKLDFITIKPYLAFKNLLVFLFTFVFIGYGTGEPSGLIGMFMMYSTIFASYPFTVGDKNGIDTLYATLPIHKKNIVTGRYIFALCLNIFMGIMSFIASIILVMILKKTFNLEEVLITILICFVLFSILEAIQLPIYFKLGYAKAKFLVSLSIVGFPVFFILMSSFIGKEKFLPFVENTFLWIQKNSLYAYILTIIIWLCIMIFSGVLSYHFYKKREF